MLVLPLYIPTLVFGARIATIAAEGGNPRPGLVILAGLTLFIITFASFTAAALRLNLR